MAKPRRENDARRTVGSHEKMMGALGRAAGWNRNVNMSDEYGSGRRSEKVIEQTGEIKGVIPGRGHVRKTTDFQHWYLKAD